MVLKMHKFGHLLSLLKFSSLTPEAEEGDKNMAVPLFKRKAR